MSLILSIFRVRLHGLLRLRPATKSLRLDCLGAYCIRCCEVMGGDVVVTDDEAKPIQAFLLKKRSGVQTLKAKGCTCVLLENGLCSQYDSRPKGCQDYPWYNIGGSLFYDSGCPGMHTDRDERPDVGTIRNIETYLSSIPLRLRQIVTWVLTSW